MKQEETRVFRTDTIYIFTVFCIAWKYFVGLLLFFTVEKGNDKDQNNTVQARFEPEIPT